MNIQHPLRRTLLGLLPLALAGCASFSPDGGFTPVQHNARQHLDKEVSWARSDEQRGALAQRVAELLAKPLSADDAVQVALFNNKGLQADFFELGIAEADLVQAGRLANPAFAFGRRTHAGEVEWERALAYNLARLLTMPMVSEMESRHFARRQREATLAMLALASDTRKAYYRAVAADQGVHYMRQVQEAAEASAELARRMREVGNWNALNQARQQAFHADASLNLALAYRAQSAARERLTRLMGLWGEQTRLQAARAPARPAEATSPRSRTSNASRCASGWTCRPRGWKPSRRPATWA